jgi:hypothetical protein
MILGGLLIDVFSIPKINCSPWIELLFHIGETLIIAGLVGLVLEAVEFVQYFEDRLSNILVEEKFLGLFGTKKLESISAAAQKQSIGKMITNPKSKWEDCFSVVVHEILPLFTRPYRENYREVVHMKIVDSGKLDAGVPSGAQVSHTTTVYGYDLIAPTEETPSSYLIGHSVTLTKIPGLDDASKYYSAKLFVDDKPVELKNLEHKIESEVVHASFTHEHKFTGVAHIKMQLEEYELSPGPSGFLSARMRDLTYNVALVAFSCEQPLILDSTVYGLTTKEIEPDKTNNMVTFTFSGWMLPGDGFFIDWVVPPDLKDKGKPAPLGNKDVENTENKRVDTKDQNL